MKTRKAPLWQGMPPCRILRPHGSIILWTRPVDPEPTCIVVHRLDGRTLPCMGDDCLFHSFNVPTEDRIFLRAWAHATKGAAILELPPTQWIPLQKIMEQHGPLNTLVLGLNRPCGAKNGRIALHVDEAGSKTAKSAGMPDLFAALTAIWAKNEQTARDKLFFRKTTL